MFHHSLLTYFPASLNGLCKLIPLLFLVVITSPTTLKAQASADQPNFIFIVVDDLNDYVDYMGGNTQTNTPRINRLSDDGVSFTNAYCNSPVCAPSRTSFMTGRSPEYTQIFSNYTYKQQGIFRDLFDPAQTVYTMPQWLKDSANYFTYGLGKLYHGWQGPKYDNDYQDTVLDPCARELSWSYFNDYHPDEGPGPLSPDESYHQGVKTFKLGTLDNSQEPEMEDYKLVDEAIGFLEDYAVNPSNYCDKPFFLGVGIHKPHYLLYAPERYFPEDYAPNLNEVPYNLPYNSPANAYPPNGIVPSPLAPVPYSDFDNMSSFAQNLAVGIDKHFYFDAWPLFADPSPIIDPALDSLERMQIISAAKRSIAQQAYMACIYFADYQINRMLQALEDNPELAANTVIILTADNSFALGEKKHWGKSALWDTDMRVPLIIVDPRNPKGELCTAPVSLIDIFPTVCDLADVDLPVMPDSSSYLDGQSLVPFLEMPSLSWNKPTVSSVGFGEGTPEGICYPHYTVMDGEFHYIRYQLDVAADCPDTVAYAEELYELGKSRNVDPHEWVDLSTNPAYAGIKDYLESWIPTDSTNFSYGAPVPSAAIVHDTLPCNWTAGDTLQLSAKWLDGFNQPVGIAPAGYTLEWVAEGDSVVYSSDSVNFVPTDTIDFSWELELYIVNANGMRVDVNRLSVLLEGATPSTDFTASLIDSSAVALTPAVIPSNTYSSSWIFGDGTVLTETTPAPYTYRMPDSVLISHTLQHKFEGYSHCLWSSDTLLVLDDSIFSNSCMAPLPPMIEDVSSGAFKVGWTEVYNATSYEIRYRKEDPFDVSWFMSQAFGNPQAIPMADQKREWEVQVRSLCDTLTSDWSYSTFFSNPDCASPSTPTVDILTSDSVHFSFNGSTDATMGYDALLRPLGAPKVYKILPQSSTGVGFGGLIPGLNYQFYMRSRCPGLDGSLDNSQIVFNFFSVSTAREELLKTETAPVINLLPNPAREKVQVNFESWKDLLDRELLLQDLQGRVLRKMTVSAGSSGLLLDLEGLTPGMYVLLFSNEPASSTRLVVTE